jgi:hypothetical protein
MGCDRRDLSDRAVKLIEPWRHLGRIISLLIRPRLRHDHPAGGIDRQMQLARCPAQFGAMLASSHRPAP